MRADPIASILAAQDPGGFWVKPGPGYSPKYRGTVWQLIFLDQMGADGEDKRVQAACAYVLSHAQSSSGGFAAWGGGARDAAPGPSLVIHCLNGNLLHALIGFGWIEDERVKRAIDWQARAITGERSATTVDRAPAGRASAVRRTRICHAPGARSRRSSRSLVFRPNDGRIRCAARSKRASSSSWGAIRPPRHIQPAGEPLHPANPGSSWPSPSDMSLICSRI